MGFTTTYLYHCWQSRKTWSNKLTKLGDWYLSGDPLELRIIGIEEDDTLTFASENVAFVPDTDDLLELIDNQMTIHNIKPTQKS